MRKILLFICFAIKLKAGSLTGLGIEKAAALIDHYYSQGKIDETISLANMCHLPSLAEYAFESNQEHLMRFSNLFLSKEISGYKEQVLMKIYGVLIRHAFVREDLFSPEFLAPKFNQYAENLIASINKIEFVNSVNEMLRNEGYLMSHLLLFCENKKSMKSVSSIEINVEEKFSSGSCLWLNFRDFTNSQLDEIIEKAKLGILAQKNIVIDLRKNCGGPVINMVRFLSLFFKEPTDVAIMASRDIVEGLYGDPKTKYSPLTLFNWGIAFQDSENYLCVEPHPETVTHNYIGKVAILVGENSFSAAENFSYIMQLYGKAKVIGHKTKGMALTAYSWEISPTIRLKAPLGEMIFSDGECLEGKGLCPDIDLAANNMSYGQAIELWLLENAI